MWAWIRRRIAYTASWKMLKTSFPEMPTWRRRMVRKMRAAQATCGTAPCAHDSAVRNYGFFINLSHYNHIPEMVRQSRCCMIPRPAAHAWPLQPRRILQQVTDPYFRGFDQRFPDYWRFKEWEREFDEYVVHDNLPNLELVRLAHDHLGLFDEAVDGVNTVETEIADNDYAVGLLVEKVAHSKYAKDTLVFVIEDDAQNGPDHVDAHRSLALIAGPYVKQRAVISQALQYRYPAADDGRSAGNQAAGVE